MSCGPCDICGERPLCERHHFRNTYLRLVPNGEEELAKSGISCNPYRSTNLLPLRSDDRQSLWLDFNHMSLVYQLTSQIAAGTVDELRCAASDRAEVVDAGFVMNVAEGVDLWLDALFDVSRERF